MMKSLQDSSFYKESRERRGKDRERVLMFTNYLDSLPESVRSDIEQTAWRIADETTEQHSSEDGWYGGIEFKRKMDRMLKRYLSGFNRDASGLMSEASLPFADREVAEQAFAAAEQELSRFSELAYIESDVVESESESESDSEREVEVQEAEEASLIEGGDDVPVSVQWAALDAEAMPQRMEKGEEADETSESDSLEEQDTDDAPAEKIHKAKRYIAPDLRSSGAAREESFGAQLEREEAEKLERLNRELRVIQEEMSEWEVSNQAQYEHAVDILVHEHRLSPEDAMVLVNGISTMSHWAKMRAIRDVRQSYFLQTREGPTKEKGMSR